MNTPCKITKILIYKALIPLIEPFRTVLATEENAETLFIKVETDSGLYGFGEVTPFDAVTGETLDICAAAAAELGRLLIGKNPLDISGAVKAMNGLLAFNTAVKSGYDLALHDIFGKAVGLPLYALLGSGKRPLKTDRTVGIDAPEIMAGKALALAKDGFSTIKVKLGQDLESDMARMEKIREAVGPHIRIRVDANQGWDFVTARRILELLVPFGLEYCEQPLPVWDTYHMARLRQCSAIPIVADESVFNDRDAFKLAAKGCCDILNIKLSKSGGIHTAGKIDIIAVSAGLRCMIGCMSDTRLALTAAAHLACACPNIRYLDLDGHFLLSQDPVIGGITYQGEDIFLPDAPGLGVDMDPEFLNRCDCIAIPGN